MRVCVPSPLAKGVSDTLWRNLPFPCSPRPPHTCAHTWMSLAVLALPCALEEEDTVALSLAREPALPRSIPHPAGFTHLTSSRRVSPQMPSAPARVGSRLCPSLPRGGLSSWGRAAQPLAFPHRRLSPQQVRPDHWGVCWRLHPDAADPNTPATPECRLQKAGAGTQQNEGRRELGGQGERLLSFERTTEKPQDSSDLFVQGNGEERSKRVNPHVGPWWKSQSRARAAMFHFLNDSDRKSRNLRAA